MRVQLSGLQIGGVALLLFSSVLLGVGVHHLVATGTCSSTGYSANLGPVPHCPSGTGWWFAFVFGGIIGALVGAVMGGGIGLIFAGIFGAIGFGALSIVLDDRASSGTKVFGAAFGGVFAVIGVAACVGVLIGAIRSLRPAQVRYGKTKTSARGAPPPPSPASMGVPGTTRTTGSTGTTGTTPLNLVPGLEAARVAATGNAVDGLSRLAQLHQQGNLTDEEFASAKAKLLGAL